MIGHINVVYVKNEIELPCRSNRVWFVKKTKQDNDVIDHIGLVYIEIETKFSGSL